MGKIVVKGDWNQHDVRIHSMGLNKADAAKMFLAALDCCRDEVYSPKIEVIK